MNTLMGVQGYGLIMTIVIGGLAGFLAEKLTKSDHGLLTNIVLGIAGAFVMRMILGFLHVPWFSGPGLINNLVVATAGAALLITVWRMIKNR